MCAGQAFLKLIATCVTAFTFHLAHCMDIKVVEHTIILSGTVADDEYPRVKDFFQKYPTITHAVLRNSHGGDAWTGYRVGEFFRDKKITTAVSGYCISSCSRMFLGGQQRLFSDDFPIARTYVGFHGHYDNQCKINYQAMAENGLYSWILKFSDEKADADLVKRWISIERCTGAVNFLHPSAKKNFEASTFFCLGIEEERPFGCEKLDTDALARGVITSTAFYSSPDQQTLPHKTTAQRYPKSGYGEVNDVSIVPLVPTVGIENYKRYLNSSSPKAFAVAPSKHHWAWNSGSDDAETLALTRCAERAKQSCQIYAVDDVVVFQQPTYPLSSSEEPSR